MKAPLRPLVPAAAVLGLGCLFALWLRGGIVQAQQTEKAARFDGLAQRIAGQLGQRLQTYEYGLRGARGAVISAGPEGITQARFLAYSRSRELDREFPGSRGFGFIRRVAPGQEAAFLRRARADGKPDFAIRELAPHGGDRLVIQYIEPEANNRQAVGLDIASEANRLQAAATAMRTGTPVLTRPITLVQASGKPKRGFLFLLPIYRSGMALDTPERRARAAYGLAYTPLVIDDVLADFDLGGGTVALALHDADRKAAPDRFYASAGADGAAADGLAKRLPVSLYGRDWLVEVKAQPGFVAGLNLADPDRAALEVVAAAALVAILAYGFLASRERRRQALLDQGRLAAIVASSNDAIIGKTLAGVVTSWNRAAEKIFGYRAEQAIGHTLTELTVPAELYAEEADILARVGNGETVPHFTTRRRRSDGRLIDVSITVSPLRDEGGRVVGAAKTVRDITEQKRSEARFHLAVEAAPTAMLMVDAGQLITLANRKAEELFGYTGAELLGLPLARLIPDRYRAAHAGHVEAFVGHASARAMGAGRELFGLRKDGSEVPVEIGLNPVETPDGPLILASITDISVRRGLEHRLQATVERLKLAVDAAGLGIWVWHLADNRLDWDERMFELYRAPASLRDSGLHYDFWRDHVHPDDVAMAERKLHQHLDGVGVYDPTFRVIRDDGSVRYIQAAAILERGPDGRPVRMVGINRDVTGAKAAEARILELNATLEAQVAERTAELHRAMGVAERANQAKSEFLANMSHEIRTPMNAVLGLCYLLEKQELTPVSRDMVQKIHGAGRSLLGIINDILDFSKIEAQRLVIEQVPFRLSDVLDNLASIMSSAVGSKAIEAVVAPVPLGADFLRGDPLRLGQVLINLAGNAIKFTDEGEVVMATELVTSDADGVRLRFSVRDTGIGIPPDKQEAIFSAFTQANNSTTRSFGGTGLGLTISRRLVELMGGTLRVASEPGKGSAFSFELPFEFSDPAHNAMPEMLHQRLLIADDQATARAVLAETAASLGWHADAVPDGDGAVELTSQSGAHPYDVLLLDWRMPGLDGLAAASRIRARFEHGDAPIIVMVTAFDRDLLAGQPGADAVDVVLSKPVTASSLYNAVLEAKNQRGRLRDVGQPARDQGTTRRLAGLRVLVVDDSDINREVAQRILADEGATVELAEDGQAALAVLNGRRDHFDVVLMDVQMPVMDGYEATRRIRATADLADLPVVALTAGAFRSQRDAAFAAGVDDFVAKPFDVDELVGVVRKLSRNGRAGAAVAPEPTAEEPPGAAAVLDLDRALKVWKDAEAYRRYLRKFADGYADAARQLAGLEGADAAAAAHRLRGAAGQLGIGVVADAAADLERRLSAGEPAAAGLARLRVALADAMAAIADYAGAPVPAPAGLSRAAAPEASAPALAALLEALDGDDAARVERVLDTLAALLPGESLRRLRTLVANYDYRAAETEARRLLGAAKLEMEVMPCRTPRS
ncbi:PAS domain S-box protein [Parasulfuritortus cantonensis]|uniref:Sensory/regulatory protein RpfC n=1 Tax=Parasulfuritortus cantonensis TaxID=2528202 RepID=A0A4R1BIU0_9PROT|nr:PAS domain S-box protein [Parasulfuritortus cantonensis]TCJ17184.1 PAS domain S-box protein [Parasulfuritortus cantonensis]